MVAPEVPTGWPVGPASLDHQPHRQVHHTVGVLTTGWGERREGRVTVLATLRTVGLRIGDHAITRTPHVEMAQVVQGPLGLFVSIGLGPTTRTRLARGGATG